MLNQNTKTKIYQNLVRKKKNLSALPFSLFRQFITSSRAVEGKAVLRLCLGSHSSDVTETRLWDLTAVTSVE